MRIGTVVVALLLSVGTAGCSGSAGSPTATTSASPSALATVYVKGTLTLNASGYLDNSTAATGSADGDPCSGKLDYSDISQGTAVLVTNQDGTPIGVGTLRGGVVANLQATGFGQCVFSFDVAVPGGQSAYTVAVSRRGAQTFTPQQVATGLKLTLG